MAELKTAIGGLTKVIARHTTLPVLGMIHVERDRQGWVHLTGTDLDTFLTLRLEVRPLRSATRPSASCLSPSCRSWARPARPDEIIDLEVLGEDKLLLRHRIGSHPVEQVISSVHRSQTSRQHAADHSQADAVNLDEAARATLLDALACASDDETRVILNGAYLDVSKPTGHYAVATDGRHLFSSNSLHLALPSSVLVPDHRFLSWSGFHQGRAVEARRAGIRTKDKGGYLSVESRRWTFTTKQVEGTYPNWRNITEDVREFTGTIEVSDSRRRKPSADRIPRLPGDDTPNHTVGLYSVSGRLYLRGSNKRSGPTH